MAGGGFGASNAMMATGDHDDNGQQADKAEQQFVHLFSSRTPMQ